jgi:hypothetical protein
MEELIQHIIAVGERVVIEQEEVLGKQFRPLVVHYISEEGTVEERHSYPHSTAMTKGWGAISGSPSYTLVVPPEFSTIEL